MYNLFPIVWLPGPPKSFVFSRLKGLGKRRSSSSFTRIFSFIINLNSYRTAYMAKAVLLLNLLQSYEVRARPSFERTLSECDADYY